MTHPEGTKVRATYADPRVLSVLRDDFFTRVLTATGEVGPISNLTYEMQKEIYRDIPEVLIFTEVATRQDDSQVFVNTNGEECILPASWVTPIDDIDPDADVTEMDTPILGAVKGVEA